ncbi:unnamed protein product [Schistocephalus solidus]|uniref:Catenin delta-2 n=1 Tax=Schistocephalus solidus TaxID=70667 RepID=A0A183SDZ3_SCHSO|nr:unnamed protein product [Schistocephalus solidus]
MKRCLEYKDEACFFTLLEFTIIKFFIPIQKRMCRMSCAEGKEVLERIQLTQPDKLFALDCIKRTLTDHQTTEGTEYILSAFNSEEDKIKALHRLTAISSYANEDLAAGGHLVYGPVGSIHGQSFPLSEHMYGPVQQQLEAREDMPNFPDTLSDKQKSMYTCHPSYAYGKVNDSAYYLGGGKPPLPPRPADNAVTGPPLSLRDPVRPTDQTDDCGIEGDPCLGLNQSGPVPIGFIDHKKKVDTQCC